MKLIEIEERIGLSETNPSCNDFAVTIITKQFTRTRKGVGTTFVPVCHIWKFDLEEYGQGNFGVKCNFSKIRIEPVMLNFLLKTENLRGKRRTTELQTRKSGQS